MARIRSIKPEFATDGKTRRLSDSTALFFILLWNHCDDAGYFTLDTWELALKTGRWRAQEVSKYLSALVQAGLVRCSTGVGVGLVEGWSHQRIDKPRPSKWKDVEIIWDDAIAIRERSKTIPRKDRIGKDRIGKDRSGEDRIIAGAICNGPTLEGAELEPKPRPSPTTTALCWRAYKQAYERRYQVEPAWNAKIAGQLRAFVSRVPTAESPEIAAFYVTHNDSFYVKSLHAVGLLLRDAEKLRTEWITGTKMLGTQAREIERRQHSSDTWDEAARILNDKRRTHEA